MKPSDFLIRGRQFFGFLIPGVMWVAWVSLLVFKINPLKFVEEKDGNAFIRTGMIIAVGYIAGFILQTLIFSLVDWGKSKIGIPKTVKSLSEQVEEILITKLPDNEIKNKTKKDMSEDENNWRVHPDHLPEFCKFYVLEHSKELKHMVLEKEDDINFLVANFIPAPMLIFALLVFNERPQHEINIAAVFIFILGYVWYRRLKHYLKKEKEEWFELFLLLELKPSEGEIKIKET